MRKRRKKERKKTTESNEGKQIGKQTITNQPNTQDGTN